MAEDFSKGIRDILMGTYVWGDVYPPKQNPPAQSVDGRTVALRILARYISELTFFRPGAPGCEAIPFQIPLKNIHVEWPDNEEDLVFPSLVFLDIEESKYVMIGLTPYIEETSRDLYAPGTVLQWQNEFTETFVVEVYASLRPERRAILAGLEVALSPTESTYGVRFRMPDYFDEPVCFTLDGRQLIEDPDAARNRRRARLHVEMRFNVVRLINYATLKPAAKTNVDVDEDTGDEVDLTPVAPEDTRPKVLVPLGTGPDLGGSKC